MDWKHLAILIAALAVGYWAHSKWPGLLSKATMGAVAA